MKTVDEKLEELPAIVENNDEPIQEKDMDCSWFYITIIQMRLPYLPSYTNMMMKMKKSLE